MLLHGKSSNFRQCWGKVVSLKTSYNHGDFDVDVKHLVNSAKQGDKKSMQLLLKAFKEKHFSKSGLEEVLRSHHDAVNVCSNESRTQGENVQKGKT